MIRVLALGTPGVGVLLGQQPPEDLPVTAVEIETGGGFFGPGNIFALLAEAGPVSWAVLATLAGFSLISWAIILGKSRRLRSAESSSAGFLKLFREASRFSEIVEALPRFRDSPLASLFSAGYREVRYQSRSGGDESGRLRVANMEAVARSLIRASSAENARLEERMTFLATTGGATPFIGLFGTVWGIMNAFQDIGFTQAANISVVAPGVSEALIATAAGLGAAIPAVIAYNAFLARIRRIGNSMDEFSMEYVTMLERHFVR